MPDQNIVVLLGHVSRDVETKKVGEYTLNSFAVCVNDNFKKGGEWEQYANFINVEAWNSKTAAKLEKGDLVSLEGRLHQDRWKTDGGDSRSQVKVIAGRVIFLRKPNEKGMSTQDAAKSMQEKVGGEIEDIGQDDIPF